MELVLGKKFKLEVWEVIVQKMALNEVAKFTVDQSVRYMKCLIFNELDRLDTLNKFLFVAGPSISIRCKDNQRF